MKKRNKEPEASVDQGPDSEKDLELREASKEGSMEEDAGSRNLDQLETDSSVSIEKIVHEQDPFSFDFHGFELPDNMHRGGGGGWLLLLRRGRNENSSMWLERLYH